MNEQDGGLQSRLVADLKRDGRRKYDEDAKRELIQACLMLAFFIDASVDH
ncbi:hypothetical protein [Burkholderia ubonensis]|nr:hypothetical protein [Burkholderia ubonensis]